MWKTFLVVILSAAVLAPMIVYWRDGKADPKPPETQPEAQAPAGRFAVFESLLHKASAKEGMQGAAVGLCVIDPKGEMVFDRHASTAFIPASSLKTLTTATALEQLGPNFRIETRLRATTAPREGVLEGDLVFAGGGDPMLTLNDLNDLARELRVNGVQRITGRVIGDGKLFGDVTIFDDFWNWGDIGNGYGSPVSGLNLEHNRFVVTLTRGVSEGALAVLEGVRPEVPGVRWINAVTTAPPDSGDGVVIYGGERTDVIHLRGTMPARGFDFSVTGAVPDPERFAAHHLRRALIAAGVEVIGEAVSAAMAKEVPLTEKVLAEHESPPLLEIVESIHATSDNHETECIHQLLGLHAGKPPAEAIREHWAERGLAFSGLRMEDGSGLARADFITPHDLAMLQFLAGSGPVAGAYKDSLLDRDNGALRWKGGAMSAVRSYAGYALGAEGEEFCFALMVNHYTDSEPVKELREAVWAALRKL